MFGHFKPRTTQEKSRVNLRTLPDMSLIEDAELEILLRLPFDDLQQVLFVNKAARNTLKRIFAGFTSRMLVEYYLDFPEVAGSFIDFLVRENVSRPAGDDPAWQTMLQMMHTKKLPDLDFVKVMQHLVKCIVMTPELACRLIAYFYEHSVEVRQGDRIEGSLELAWYHIFHFLVANMLSLHSVTQVSEALTQVIDHMKETDKTEAGIAFARALKDSVETSLLIIHHNGPLPIDLTQLLLPERKYYLNLSEIDLTGRVLNHLNLSGIRFYQAKMPGVTLHHCNASYSDFSSADKSGSTLSNTRFFRSLCRNINLDNCTAIDCTFEKTDMRGVNDTGLTRLNFKNLMGDCNFINCKINNVLLWDFGIKNKKIILFPSSDSDRENVNFMQKFTIFFLIQFQLEQLAKSKNPEQKDEKKKLLKFMELANANPTLPLYGIYREWLIAITSGSMLLPRESQTLPAPRLDLTPLQYLIPMMERFLSKPPKM